MAETAAIRLERDGHGVATVTLDRPHRKNALAASHCAELLAAVEAVAGSESDRVLVITGAGGAFCAGPDLSAADPAGPDLSATDPAATDPAAGDRAPADPAAQPPVRIQDVALALTRLPKPVIAAVDGPAVGAGFGLALAADIVLCSDTARFSAIFIRRALSVDTGLSYLLPRLVGQSRARELALTGRMVHADEAQRIGLVTDVVPPDRLLAAATETARRLAAGSATALRLIKHTMRAGADATLEEALAVETSAQLECVASAEFAAARAAFASSRSDEKETADADHR